MIRLYRGGGRASVNDIPNASCAVGCLLDTTH